MTVLWKMMQCNSNSLRNESSSCSSLAVHIFLGFYSKFSHAVSALLADNWEDIEDGLWKCFLDLNGLIQNLCPFRNVGYLTAMPAQCFKHYIEATRAGPFFPGQKLGSLKEFPENLLWSDPAKQFSFMLNIPWRTETMLASLSLSPAVLFGY